MLEGMDDRRVLDPVTLLQRRAEGLLGVADWIHLDPVWSNTDILEMETPNCSGEKAAPFISQYLAQQAEAARGWLSQHYERLRHHECLHHPEQGQDVAEVSSPDKTPLTGGLLLLTSNPLTFLIWFIAAVSASVPVFLGNPRWTAVELQRVIQTIEPALVMGNPGRRDAWAVDDDSRGALQGLENGTTGDASPLQNFSKNPQVFHSFPHAWGKPLFLSETYSLKAFEPCSVGGLEPQPVENSSVFIPTGGSSGELRFVKHSWRTLLASVVGLQASNLLPDGASIDSFCLLPLHHVSGLMQVMRSLISGGSIVLADHARQGRSDRSELYRRFPAIQPETYFISLVPTQLQRLLLQEGAASWLRRFRAVLLGGAPAWPTLLSEARLQRIPLAPTYGMTETASQVVTLVPQDFLAGQTGCGQVLPHAQVEICDRNGQSLARGQTGVLRVRSRSLAQGYVRIPLSVAPFDGSVTSESALPLPLRLFPEDCQGPFLDTDDLGFFDAAGYLHIVGRSSDKIISGGENVFPAEVEAAIRATGLVADVVVMGIPDGEWGERVVAVYVARSRGEIQPVNAGVEASLETLLADAMVSVLSPAKRPKRWFVTDALPRSPQGKLNRKALRQWLAHQAASSDVVSPQLPPSEG